MFIEQDHNYLKNRQDAHYATARPALLVNGEAGVSIRIGKIFTVLSKAEFEAFAAKARNAIGRAERETTPVWEEPDWDDAPTP